MAHFIGEISTCRSPVIRLGQKNTGLATKIGGWKVGGEMRIRYNPESQEDEITFTLTGGSGAPGVKTVIARYSGSGDKLE